MQDSWMALKAEEIQGYADRNESKNFFIAKNPRRVINHPSAISAAAIDRLPKVEINADLDLSPSLPETIRAVQQLYSGKASGSDAILAEICKPPNGGSPHQKIRRQEADFIPSSSENMGDPTIDDIVFREESIWEELKSLKECKSPGPDEITAKLFFELAQELAKPLSFLCQKSFDAGIIPTDWKTAHITPLYKSGSRALATNYRPVSLTSICCKVMEKTIKKELMAYFETNNLLSNARYGFQYTKDNELIPKYTSIVVRRVPRLNTEAQKRKPNTSEMGMRKESLKSAAQPESEAYALKKKEKRAFTAEENPPYVPPEERMPPEEFTCPLCHKLFRDAVLVSCCGTTFCNDCIMGHVFDSDILGSHQCPVCKSSLNEHETTVFENTTVRNLVRGWLRMYGQNEVTNFGSSPEKQLKPSTPEPEKVVRRVLKPKQPVLLDTSKPSSHGADQQNPLESSTTPVSTVQGQPPVKPENSAQLPEPPTLDHMRARTLPFPPKSDPSLVNNVKNYSPNKNLPIVSNTTTGVADAPCATVIGAQGTSVVSTAPISTSSLSFSRVTAPVLPSIIGNENTALVNAMYGTSLVGMTSAAASNSLAQIAGVYPNVSLMPSGILWPQGDIPYLNNVDQNALLSQTGVFSSTPDLVAPLFGIQSRAGDGVIQGGAFPKDKLLSKEEFYQWKMQLMQQSRKIRSARSRSRDSTSRGVRRRSGDRNHRRDERSNGRLRERHYRDSSRENTGRHSSRGRRYGRVRSRSHSPQPIEDYDAWRRRKDRKKLVERDSSHSRFSRKPYASEASPAEDREVRGRFRPNNCANESSVPVPDRPSRVSRRRTPPSRTQHTLDPELSYSPSSRQHDLFINPERGSQSPRERSPHASVVPEYAPSDTASSRGPTPQSSYRLQSPIDVGHLADNKEFPSGDRRATPRDLIYNSREVDFEELDARALKRLKKEQKRKLKHERKRARKAARALREAEGPALDEADGEFPGLNDGDFVETKVRHKKRKHKKKREGSESAPRKSKKSKRRGSSLTEPLEIC
ncbi:E3 ubiquitin-protein ligase rbbp6 [Sparganum proliferum]